MAVLRMIPPLIAAVLLLTAINGAASAAPPSSANAAEPAAEAPPLVVRVDPRVELMSIIFRLAGDRQYTMGRVPAYTAEVDEHFGPFCDHAVVKLARSLSATRGIACDAPMSMAVHWADAYHLDERIPLSPRPQYLDSRWTVEDARAFLVATRRFVKDASFREFSEKHRPLYELTEKRFRTLLEQQAHLEWFNEFFGQRSGATFVAVPALLNGPISNGVRRRAADGKEELYCLFGVYRADQDGMPAFDEKDAGTIVHEFCHSYANPIIDHHASALQAAGEKLFPRVAAQMQSRAYGTWQIMFYESLVRACVVRHTLRYEGIMAAANAAQQEREKGFLWMPELADLLGQYETQRAQYPTLEAFSPRLVAFFNDYEEKAAAQEAALRLKRPKIVSMVPANGATDVDPARTTFQVTFDRPMKDGWAIDASPEPGEMLQVLAGKPSYDAKHTTWTVYVTLRPGRKYSFMLNSGRYSSFQSQEGVPLEPTEVTFQTVKAASGAGEAAAKRP
jgi:hypothetical protein